MSRILVENKKKIVFFIVVAIMILLYFLNMKMISILILLLTTLMILVYCANKIVKRKILQQKSPFAFNSKIRNVDYLVLGEICNANEFVPSGKSFVQIQYPNMSLLSIFEILKHVWCILDEDDGNLVIVTKEQNKKKGYSVFDIPFFADITKKRLKLQCLSKKSNYPLLVDPYRSIRLLFNHKLKGFSLSQELPSEIREFCADRWINVSYYTK